MSAPSRSSKFSGSCSQRAQRLAVDERLEQPAEIVEVAVHDRPRDPRPPGDGLDRDGVEAVLDDDRLGRVQQLLAPLLAGHSCGHAHIRLQTVAYGYVTTMDVSDRHRRQRLLRARAGGPPARAGDRRLRGARTRRRRRRDVALQHVSRLHLRRAVAPVLVLVRAQPGLDAHLLAPARDPRLPRARRRGLRRDGRTSGSTPRSAAPTGTRPRSAGGSRPARAR